MWYVSTKHFYTFYGQSISLYYRKVGKLSRDPHPCFECCVTDDCQLAITILNPQNKHPSTYYIMARLYDYTREN